MPTRRYRLPGRPRDHDFGAVYQAADEDAGRTVALYRLTKSDSLPDSTIERVLENGPRLADLSHPSLVKVFETGRDGEGAFLVTEWIEGSSLRELFQEQSGRTPEGNLKVFQQVGEAVAYAHRHGFLHLNLSLARVLVTRKGNAKLEGLGFAPSRAEETSLRAGADSELSSFTAPEVLSSPETADARADVYSLGKLLYCLLTEMPAKTVQIERMPEAFRRVVLRATELDATARYETVDEMLAAVEDILETQESILKPSPTFAAPEPYDAYLRFFQLIDQRQELKGRRSMAVWLGEFQHVARRISDHQRERVFDRRVLKLRFGSSPNSRSEALFSAFQQFALGGTCDAKTIQALRRFREKDPLPALLSEAAESMKDHPPMVALTRGALALPLLMTGAGCLVAGLVGSGRIPMFRVFVPLGGLILGVGLIMWIASLPRFNRPTSSAGGRDLAKRFQEAWSPRSETG